MKLHTESRLWKQMCRVMKLYTEKIVLDRHVKGNDAESDSTVGNRSL